MSDLKAIFKGYVGMSLSSLRTCSFFADRPYQIPVPRSAMEQCVPGGPVVEECEPPEIVC